MNTNFLFRDIFTASFHGICTFPSLHLLLLNNNLFWPLDSICIAEEIQRNDESYLHRSLETSIRDSKAFAIQLRMLEVFTSHNSYYNPNDPARSRKDAAMVTVYLVRNGNYRCITLGKKFMLHSSFSQTVYCTSFA